MADISIFRGDSRIVAIPVFDADLNEYRKTGVDQTTNPTLDDVAEVDYVVSDNAARDTTYIEKDLSDSDVEIVQAQTIQDVDFDSIPNEAAVVRVKLNVSDTQPLPIQSLRHECQLTDINGDATTIMTGAFEVQESATNPP
jgi:hypothetical protein